MGSCYSSKTKDGKEPTINMPGPRPKSNINTHRGLKSSDTAKKESGATEAPSMVVNANLRHSQTSLSKLSSSTQSLDNKNVKQTNNPASSTSTHKTAPESKLKSRFGFGLLRKKDDENSNKTSSQSSIHSQTSSHGGSMEKVNKLGKEGKTTPLVESKNRNNLENKKNDSLSKTSKSPVIQRPSPGSSKRPVSAEYNVESKALKAEKSTDVQSAKAGECSAIPASASPTSSSNLNTASKSSRMPVGGRGPLLSKLQAPKPLKHTDHFAARNISPYPSPQITRNLSTKSVVQQKPTGLRHPSKVHSANTESTYNSVEKEKDSEENGNISCQNNEQSEVDSAKVQTSKPETDTGVKASEGVDAGETSSVNSVQNLTAQVKRVSLTLNGSERFTPDSLPDTPFNKRAPLATFDSSVEGSSFASLLSDDLMLDYDDEEELDKTLCKSLSAASTPGEEKSILQQFAMAARKSPGEEKSVLQQFALMSRKTRPRSRSVEALRKKSLGKSPLVIDSTDSVSEDKGVGEGGDALEKDVGNVKTTSEDPNKENVDLENTSQNAPIIEEEIIEPTVHSAVENRPTVLDLSAPKKVSLMSVPTKVQTKEPVKPDSVPRKEIVKLDSVKSKIDAEKPKETKIDKKPESKLPGNRVPIIRDSKLQKKSGLVQRTTKSGSSQPAAAAEKSDKTEKVKGKPPTSLARKPSFEKKTPSQLTRSATMDSHPGTRGRSQTLSELNQLVHDTTAKPPHLRSRSQSSPLKPPRPRSVSSLDEEDYVHMDGYNYRHIMQDVTTFKTMLHKLKRVLQDEESVSPFELEAYGRGTTYRGSSFGSDTSTPVTSIPETGSLKRQRFREVGHAASSTTSLPSVDQDTLVEENNSLRHQVVALQRQLEDKDRTIKLLQQQMTKYTDVDLENLSYQSTATQTEEDLKDNKTLTKKLQRGQNIPQKTHVNDILEEVTRRSNENAENFRNRLSLVEDTFTAMTGNLRSVHRTCSQTSLNKVT